jgi:predicted ribosome quality control (RQC) complex YloA/Tae2 family protein
MLLRKHLSGGTILNIEQYNMDRIIFIDISSLDELGQSSEKRLIIEIMGKHSNIMLVEKSTFKIIDSIRRVTQDMSRVRQILPGLIYEYPPTNNKVNPLFSRVEEFNQFIKSEKDNTPIFKFFYFNYLGLSPLISKEICFVANIDSKRPIESLDNDEISSLYSSFKLIMENVLSANFNPLYITRDKTKDILAFYALDLKQFGEKDKWFISSISELLDIVYKRKDIGHRIGQRSQSIKKAVSVKLERSINKLEKQNIELEESKDREIYKIYADLISANIHKINAGTEEIQVENFYDENMGLISIPLDKKISAPLNAQKYYKKYSKLKTANSLLQKEIPETKNEILYLENVLMSIENATEIKELNEIKEELIEEGYIKDTNRNSKKKKKQESLSKPLKYISQDGYNIYVGKNNKQNDYLTLKFAQKEDLWLHVYNMPGSHVIVQRKDGEVPDTTIEDAAALAAHFSSGKNGSHVPIAYTERKNVKKPKGAKTGMVIFNNYKTLTITPTEEWINSIKKAED